MTIETAPEAPAKRSRWEDFVDIFFAPADLFKARAQESWVKPFLLLCGICIVLYYIFLPLNALVWEAAMIENAPPNADLDKMRQGAHMMKYLGGVFVPVGYSFVIAISAVALKLATAVLEPGATWSQSFLISTYSMFVALPQQIIGAFMVYLKSRSGTVGMKDMSFGVLRFMDKPDPVLRNVLGRLDLFAIWAAVLCAVGLVVVVRMPRVKAIAAAAIAWLAIALPGLVSAALFHR